MAHLAVDKNGNLYQVSGDRADGLGFGHYPTAVSQTDVTLGSAYLKAQAQRTADQLRRGRAQAILDHQDAVVEKIQENRRRAISRKEAAMGALARHPAVMDRLTRQALQGGYEDGMCNAMNGNTLSANGQSGWRGMNRDQQIIHHTLSGGTMGKDVSRKVDPSDMSRASLMNNIDTVLRANSIKVRR